MSESQPTTHHQHDNRTELEKVIRRSGPWFAENATTLIYALAAFLAIAAVVVYMKRTPAGDLEASRGLLFAQTPEDYRDVADEFPNTKIGIWARLRQGDRLRDDAVAHMFSDRPLGLEELESAEAAYKQLADRDDLTEQARERVLIGLARIADTRLDGTQAAADNAVAAYQRVLDEFPASIDKLQSEARIAQISTDASKTWSAWFHELKPTPAPDVPGIPGMDGLNLNLGTDVAPETSETPAAPAAETPDEPAAPEAAADAAPDKKTEAKPEEPVKETLAKEEPAKEEPAKEEPAKEEPAKEEPAKEEPAKEAPAKEEPAKEEPTEEAPAETVDGDSKE